VHKWALEPNLLDIAVSHSEKNGRLKKCFSGIRRKCSGKNALPVECIAKSWTPRKRVLLKHCPFSIVIVGRYKEF